LRQVWFVCHGYQQLASRFARYFAAIDDGHTYIVAPEALSRFYIDEAQGEHSTNSKVGASWMTREDRLNEIVDYVKYLDRLYADVFETIDRRMVQVVALGFSQGVATVSRWLERGEADIDHLIAWGSLIPNDVDLGADRYAKVAMRIVIGDDDVITPQAGLDALEERLAAKRIAYELVRFKGGHHLNKDVLTNLLEEIERASDGRRR